MRWSPAGGVYVMTSPTFRSATGTTSSSTSDPRSYVPVIDPETIAYRCHPNSDGSSTSMATTTAARSAAPVAQRPTERIVATSVLGGVEVELDARAVALVGVARGGIERDRE